MTQRPENNVHIYIGSGDNEDGDDDNIKFNDSVQNIMLSIEFSVWSGVIKK